MAVLVTPAVGGADSSQSTASLRAQSAALAAKSRSAVLGVYSLDRQLETAQSRVAALRTEEHLLRGERMTLRHALVVARHGSLLAQQHLGARLRILYEQGNVEPLEILFGASSLDDALTSLDNLNRVTAQDEAVLRDVRAAREHLIDASSTLARRAARLHAAVQEASASEAALERTRAQRAAYIGSLAKQRRLTERQISALVARAQTAAASSAQITRSTANVVPAVTLTQSGSAAVVAAVSPPAAPSPGARTITVTATGYSLGGTTSTGLPVGWGVAAVDPSVIPLGSHLLVPGYGEAVAADTGGGIVGAMIDLWFPSVAQASAWGRRVVTVTLAG